MKSVHFKDRIERLEYIRLVDARHIEDKMTDTRQKWSDHVKETDP